MDDSQSTIQVASLAAVPHIELMCGTALLADSSLVGLANHVHAPHDPGQRHQVDEHRTSKRHNQERTFGAHTELGVECIHVGQRVGGRAHAVAD